ncbi:Gfo/Idh/MocA family oxidoreductase [bacterium]|nr:Gfo/Idh/MocA family oxidoreductase [bacterium]
MSIRIGFVGTGGIAQHHMNHLIQIEDAKIICGYDISKECLINASKRFGFIPYEDLDKMLDSETLDCVYICIPPFAHGDVEKKVIERGLPFFVEKPIGINLNTIKEILALIERKDIIVSVGYHWRYMDITKEAKERVSPDKIGMILGYWMGGLPMVPWWRKKEQSGGQFVEQTTHIVDLARFIVGDITEVYALFAKRLIFDVEGMDVPDVGTVSLKFENGVIGNISNTCGLNFGYTVGLHIYARDLVLELLGNKMVINEPKKKMEIQTGLNPYLEEDRIFINAVKTKDPSCILSTYRDAAKTLAVTLSAWDSANMNKAIKVPEI